MANYPERFEELTRRNQFGGSSEEDDIKILGALLSVKIHCPVRWPAFDHNTFMCNCGVDFPVYAVQAEAWDMILEKHEKGDEVG